MMRYRRATLLMMAILGPAILTASDRPSASDVAAQTATESRIDDRDGASSDRTPATQPVVEAPATRPAAKEPASRPADGAGPSDGMSARANGPKLRPIVPDPKQVGGEPEGIVQVANLVYAGTQSSKCFSDHFLVRTEKESAISTSRRFHAVKLSAGELFNFPFVIMTGEGDFVLPEPERENLRTYVERGGFLLASAGCSSREWDRSFRREMAAIFPKQALQKLDMDHPVFHTVYEIKSLRAKQGRVQPLEAIMVGGRIGVLYSQDGLNDTAHATGCCCCGGNEITNANEVNVNVLAYALIY